jgi:hypothetical protein
MSALRLGAVCHEGLVLVAGQLRQMIEQASSMDVSRLYLEAMELARDRSSPIDNAFRTYYLSGFNWKARRDGSLAVTAPTDGLSLLDPDDLEASLAATNLANALFNACSEELYGLDKRVGLLINSPEIGHEENPLGPETIGKAIIDAIRAQKVPIKVTLLLAAQLSRFLPERVRDIYREINGRLVELNVLPTIRVGMRRPGRAEAVEAAITEAPADNSLLGVLRKLLTGGALAAGQPHIPAPLMPGEVAAPAGNGEGSFMQTLDRLQHGRGEAVSGLDPAALGDGRVNVLRGLREGGAATTMNPLDAMTLDIVAMIFDYILDDYRIPDGLKALIGRLQIPMLKVAMLDKGFFSQKSHPARRFLDSLADAAIGWDPAEGHEGGLYRKTEQLVLGILEGFDSDLAIFENALADLRAWLDEEKQAADRIAARSALAIRSREQAEMGRRIGHDEVQVALIGHPVPPAIRAFLGEHWSLLLAVLYQRVGVDSPVWKAAVATMNDLIWSVGPKADAGDRKRLVGLLPGLLKRLNEGVRYLGLPEVERNAFFTSLVKCHAEAVKGTAPAEFERPVVEAAPEPVVAHAEPAGFVPVAELPAAGEDETIEVLAMADQEGRQFAPNSALTALKRGSWIAYRTDNGDDERAKLSWVSPLRGIFLFTNRQGRRAMSINAEGLAAKLATGEVRVLDATPLMERAVDSLMEQLQRNAA